MFFSNEPVWDSYIVFTALVGLSFTVTVYQQIFSFVHKKEKVIFQNLNPFCSSLVVWSADLHPNCWDHPNFQEAIEHTSSAST